MVEGRRRTILLATSTIVACVLFAQTARVLNGNIGYADALNCDSWYFLGLEFNFEMLYDSRTFYQSVRFPALLPWTYLAPSIAYSWFNGAKFLTYFIITCSGFMWFSTRLYGIRVAILNTVLFCCSTSFLGVLSHDYLTGAALGWISLFVATTVEAAGSRRVLPWSVPAGVFFGLCIYTHLPTVVFIWAIPLLFFARRPQEAGRIVVRVAAYVLGLFAGFVLVSLGLGLYNKSLGGRFYYLGEQIRIARILARSGYGAGFTWRGEGIIAVMFTMLAASGLVLGRLLWDEVLRHRHHQERMAPDTVLYPALVCFATLSVILVYEAKGGFILSDGVYSPWIYPIVFVGIGAILSQVVALRTIPWRTFTGVVAVMFVVFLVAATRTRTRAIDHSLYNAILVAGIAVLAVFFFLGKSRWGALVLIPLTCLMVFNFPTKYGSTPWYAGEGSQSKNMTFQAVKALNILDDLDIGERPAFWVGAREREVVSVPRSFLYCSNFPGSFPSTSVGTVDFEPAFLPLSTSALEGHKFLVVVAPGSDLGPTAQAALRGLGFQSTIVGEWPIGSGDLETSMAVLKIESTLPSVSGA